MGTSIDKLALYYSVAFTVILACGAWAYYSMRHKSMLYAALLSITLMTMLASVLPAPGYERLTLFHEVAAKEVRKVSNHYKKTLSEIIRGIYP